MEKVYTLSPDVPGYTSDKMDFNIITLVTLQRMNVKG